jgi:hypothetical protein
VQSSSSWGKAAPKNALSIKPNLGRILRFLPMSFSLLQFVIIALFVMVATFLLADLKG